MVHYTEIVKYINHIHRADGNELDASLTTLSCFDLKEANVTVIRPPARPRCFGSLHTFGCMPTAAPPLCDR
jgi:hypothetical protein